MTGPGRRIWDDRALESGLLGMIAFCAGLSGLVFGAASLALATLGGAPWWLYASTAALMVVCTVAAVGGRRAAGQAREHSAAMRSYGESITAEFDKLLEERSRDK